MKRLMLYFNLLSLPFHSVLAQEHAKSIDKEDEFRPPTYHLGLPDIKALEVLETGKSASFTPEYSAQCREFVLAQQQAREYLQHTRGINRQDIHYYLDWSPCFAHGTVEFVDGQTAKWRIDSFQGGVIIFSTGTVHHLYCETCPTPALPGRQ